MIDERTVKINAWSSAEWKVTLPAEGALGNYSRSGRAPKRPAQTAAGRSAAAWRDTRSCSGRYVPYTKRVGGSFLVAAYRRPDFRVDVTLNGESAMAGDPLKGVVSARYLFGASMGARPLNWTFTKYPLGSAPGAVVEAFPDDRWIFVGWREQGSEEQGEIRRDQGKLEASGQSELTLPTKLDAGVPYSYTFEGDVEDVSRQHIANRASFTVHPAPWYIGIRRPPYFIEQKNGLKTAMVAVSPGGRLGAERSGDRDVDAGPVAERQAR